MTTIQHSPISFSPLFNPKPLHHHHLQSPFPKPKPTNLSISTPFRVAIVEHKAPDHPQLRALLHLASRHRDLALGRAIHACITKSQHHEETDDKTHLFNSLISMYLKVGRLFDARKVFDAMPYRDVVSYSSLVSAYAKCGLETDALELFDEMRESGIEPNEHSFVAVLTNCIRRMNGLLGYQVHGLAIKSLHWSCVYVANAIMGLYVKCGCLDDALRVFGVMPERDVSSWNAVILGMVEDCRYSQVFEAFHDMRMDGIDGDRFSLSTLLTAVSEGFSLVEGQAVHAYALKVGLELDLSVGNALVGFYTRFGCLEDVVDVFQRMPVKDVISWTGMLTGFMEFGMVEAALEVFDQMPERNSISYNALLAGLCRNGEGYQGLELFQRIMENGVEISDFTLTSAVNACALLSDEESSEQIHAFVVKVGCKSNPWIEAALLDMCARCGRMEDSQKLFKNLVHEESFLIAWTSLICAYVRNGQPDEALSLFHTILKRNDSVVLDEVMLATILGVCGTLGFEEMGKQIHNLVIKSGGSCDSAVCNAVLSMYAKCGNLEDAMCLFGSMPQHDIVAMNALINAHLLHRQGDAVLSIWGDMEELGVKPDGITFLLLISACKYTKSKSTDTCWWLFRSMASSCKIEPSSEHYAAMVDVLGYWGCFDEAEKLIHNMPFKPNALVWRALLDSCRLRSNITLGKQAIQKLLVMEPQDPSTYVLVSNLYLASGRWHCSEKVREEMRGKGLQKHPARSWIIHSKTVHSFYTRDRSHPQSKDIYSGLEVLILECMKAGYEPDTSYVLHDVEEYQKKDFLFYHSAKLAATYGHLVTELGQPVRVVKNIRLCGDCHTFLKLVSSVTRREISFRDTTGFHHFKGGRCSCGDYW
ncbi:putative tetratricopeptide-like helical domain superfamily, DYW domain-containing protein [Dioscorea sansibarensis]